VNSLGRKDVEIVDYKTGKPRKDADARKDLQLSIYALAAKEIFEWNPTRLVFHYLQNNQRQETSRDAKQIAEAEATVQETAADIRAGTSPPGPSSSAAAAPTSPFALPTKNPSAADRPEPLTSRSSRGAVSELKCGEKEKSKSAPSKTTRVRHPILSWRFMGAPHASTQFCLSSSSGRHPPSQGSDDKTP